MGLLVCPVCRGELLPALLRTERTEALSCPACRLDFPVVDGVPWMLPALATPSSG